MKEGNEKPILYAVRQVGRLELSVLIICALLFSITSDITPFSFSHFTALCSNLLALSVVYAASVIFARQMTPDKFRFVQLVLPSLLLGLAAGTAFMLFIAAREPVYAPLILVAPFFFGFGLWPAFVLVLGAAPRLLKH